MVEGVVGLGGGDPYLPSPGNVRVAAKKAIDSGYTHYYVSSELKRAVAEMLKEDSGIDVDLGWAITITSGGLNALFSTILATVNPGDEVLMPIPYFPRFRQITITARAVPVYYSLLEDEIWRPDLEELEKGISSKTRLLILNSPNNPTGGVINQKDLKVISEIAQERNLLVLSDEVYANVVYYPSRHYSITSLPGMEERTVIIGSVSKAYAMCGWRVGWVVCCNRDLAKRIDSVVSQMISTPCSVSQMAALEALRTPKALTKGMLRMWRRHRDIAYNRLMEMPGILCQKAKGALYMFPDHSRIIKSSLGFVEFLIKEAKVSLGAGSHYGKDGHVRLGFSCQPMDKLELGLERMEKAIRKVMRR